MAKVSESIYASNRLIIPLADVQHIEPVRNNRTRIGIQIITKHTKWNNTDSMDCWENAAYLPEEEADEFLRAFCTYRHELEGGKDAFTGAE